MPEENLPTVYEAEEAALAKFGPDDRTELSKKVRENLSEILQAMVESAKGLWVERTVVTKDGIETKVPVYQEKPNMEVSQYLLNQLMGRPKETQVDVQLRQNVIIQNEIKITKMDQPIEDVESISSG